MRTSTALKEQSLGKSCVVSVDSLNSWTRKEPLLLSIALTRLCYFG